MAEKGDCLRGKYNLTKILETPQGKREFNEYHFTVSAPHYDFVTRALSFGQDKKWKRMMVEMLPSWPSPYCCDLACGTGDLTLALAAKYPNGHVVGLDLTQAMLDLAQKRHVPHHVKFQRSDMVSLPYPNETVDIVTGGYALRNAPDLPLVLDEIYRVTKPGGMAAFLDFSKPKNKALQILQVWLLKIWGSLWGLLLHGDPRIHGYISASLKTYPNRDQMQTLLTNHGFDIVMTRRFFFGMTEIITIQKANLRL